ncbi:ABC transporter permease [Kineobactrum sediminis]|uniref:ABC transporter permease n=1 Tax=Kineobactrum sediminis TaxID=1905677 RepID=A0A2N5XZM2_9GAMM|nr:ABC transporter permease [Kineobactrum sediminis]
MWRLAARNVFRHRGRSSMTLFAIAFGVVALILAGGFIKDTVDELGESMIHSQSGHIQVSRSGYREHGTRDAGAYLIDTPEALRSELAAVPGVDEVLLRMVFTGLLNNGRTDWAIMGEGVEPAAEARLGTYINVSEGRQLEAADSYGMMLGAGVAQALDLAPGDWANLLTNTPDGAVNVLEFEVVGIFQTFSKDYDARAVRIPLAAAQELMGDDGVHLAVLTLQRTGDTDAVAARVAATMVPQGYEVLDWTELNPFYEQTVELYQQQFGFLVAVILLMVTLSVSNAINMNVHERAAEFGTMKACGGRQNEILRLIIAESAILGLLGAGFGIAAGNLLALGISAIGIPMPPPPNSDLGYISLIRLGWEITLLSGLIGLLAPIVAAVRPALRASRADIAESLREGV